MSKRNRLKGQGNQSSHGTSSRKSAFLGVLKRADLTYLKKVFVVIALCLSVPVAGEIEPFGSSDPGAQWFRSLPYEELANAPAEQFVVDLFRVYSLDHQVNIGDGIVVHVTEHFTLYSWLRRQRRGVVFLSGSAFQGNHWSIPVEGYDATSMVARRGMFAYTLDHLGVGLTTAPASGSDVTFGANIAMVSEVIDAIRSARRIPRLDLIGAGYGGSIAAHIAADSNRIRSCVMTAMLYTDLVGGPLTDPGFVAFLENAPNGYIDFPAAAYLPVIGAAPAEVQQYVLESQPGIYPAHNFLVATQLPFFDPAVARVPGLVIYGSEDTVGGPSDPFALAADYGRFGAELLIIEGGSHATRMDPPEIANQFWSAIFEFID